MDVDFTNYIFATKDELERYYSKISGKNKIHIFWRNLIIEMPRDIYFELKRKPTNLKETKTESKVTGAKEYKFVTEGASEELKEYLRQFSIFVEV